MKKTKLLSIFLLCLATLTGCGQPTYVEVTSIELNRNVVNLNIGETVQLSANPKTSPSDAPKPLVSYWSSDEAIATVSETGLVTAIKGGDASILAISGSKTAICSIFVTEPDIAEVSVSKARMSGTFDAPYYSLEGKTFDAPLYLYSEKRKSDNSFDIVIPYGAEKTNAVKNFAVVKALSERFLSGSLPVLEDFDALQKKVESDPEQGAALLAKDALHFTSLDSTPYFALTTEENGAARVRYLKEITGDAIDLLFTLSFLPTILSNLSGVNLKSLFELLSSQTGSIELGNGLLRDLLLAMIGSFEVTSKEKETGTAYHLSANAKGCQKLSDFLFDHKKQLGLKDDYTIKDIDLSALIASEGISVQNLDFQLAFDCKGQSNSVKGGMTPFGASEKAPSDYMDGIRELYKNA